MTGVRRGASAPGFTGAYVRYGALVKKPAHLPICRVAYILYNEPVRRVNPARWQAVVGRLGREHTIWMATMRRDGRPHLVPLWFVWFEAKIYVSTATHTQKYRNLVHNQMVSLSLPDAEKVVIIEGEAHVAGRETVDIVAEYFYDKYEWDFRYDESANWRLVEITPHKILAWGDGYDHEGTHLL